MGDVDFEHGVARDEWPRWVFEGEHGERLRRETREECERLGIPLKVAVVVL